jgi:rod shape determining protein RodA
MAVFERFRSTTLTRSSSLRLTGNLSDPVRNIDWILMTAVIAQAVIGLFIVFSTTHLRLIDQNFDPFVYTQRQVIFVIFGAATMAAVMALGHDWFRSQATLLYGGTILLLVLVLVGGAVTGGARLAFDLGPISLQPAEFAKPVILVLIAGYIADAQPESLDWHHFVMSLYIVLVPAGLMLLQPDLGSASVVIAGVAGMMYVANAKRRYLALVFGLSVVTVAATILAFPRLRYQLRRFDAWLNQDSFREDLQNIVLQVRFAKRAVSTGGFFGKGYLEGPLTNGKYIPVQFTDFPFSAIGEQFGMIGGGVVIALFVVILWRIWRIAQMSRNRYGMLLATGVFAMLTDASEWSATAVHFVRRVPFAVLGHPDRTGAKHPYAPSAIGPTWVLARFTATGAPQG